MIQLFVKIKWFSESESGVGAVVVRVRHTFSRMEHEGNNYSENKQFNDIVGIVWTRVFCTSQKKEVLFYSLGMESGEAAVLPYLIMATQLTHMSELFNVKILQYGNGQVEIRTYDKVINMQYLNKSAEEVAKSQQFGKQRMNDVCTPDIYDNPFTGESESLYTFGQLDMLKQRKERCLKSSLNRTKQEIYKISRQCRWEYFLTLTFSPEVIDRYDYSTCMKKANKWFNNQKNRYAKDLQYVFVPEQHKDGAWHIHGLIAQVGSMSFADSGKKFGSKTVFNLSGWRNGFSTAVKIGETKEDLYKVSSYICKYITKELCEVTKGKKRYFRSQNIAEPIETNVLVEGSIDSYIQMVADSLGVDLDYEKEVNGFLNVNCKYYKVNEESEEKENG